jgi:hypothetical protein
MYKTRCFTVGAGHRNTNYCSGIGILKHVNNMAGTDDILAQDYISFLQLHFGCALFGATCELSYRIIRSEVT